MGVLRHFFLGGGGQISTVTRLHFDLQLSGIQTCVIAPLLTDDVLWETCGVKVGGANSGAATLSLPSAELLKHKHKLGITLPAGVTQTTL